MDKSLLRFISEGSPSLLVWKVPPELSGEAEAFQTFVIPIMVRKGGALYAVPDGALSGEVLLDAVVNEEVVGPSREFSVQLCVEDDLGQVADLAAQVQFYAVDLDDVVLTNMREYDPVTDSLEVVRPFSQEHVNALPRVESVMPDIVGWVEQVAQEKLNFYSAREEQAEEASPPAPKPSTTKKTPAKKTSRVSNAGLAEKVESLAAQVRLLLAAQANHPADQDAPAAGFAIPASVPGQGAMIAKVPSLSSGITPGMRAKQALALVGPPPKAKPVPQEPPLAADVDEQQHLGSFAAASQDPMFSVLSQQSAALTHLVAHLTTGDPMADLAATSSGATGLSTHTKGVARREKMQGELASRSSNYFQQVQHQIYKRMNPSRPMPNSSEDVVKAGCTMASYLERYGGYKNAKETGMTLWILSHAFDAAAQDDFHATKEYLAILAAVLEQSALDGNWNLAYILSLMEDPPQTVFADRMVPLAATGRPFSPLIPPTWAAVALAYVKEIDILSTRKGEIKKDAAPSAKAAPDASNSPSPKRKPRFPKKPKAGGESST